MSWLEISLIVDGELAEAVAEVLSRYVEEGVVIESTEIEDTFQNEGHPVGPLRVAAYLPADSKLEETRQRIEEALWYLSRIRPLPAPEFRPVQQVNWAEAWKQHYRPIPIGRRLIIVPAWLAPPEEETKSRTPIFMQVGMAFGTGTHPTTQLSLEFLDLHTPPGGDILDIGCGSGILSIAALKLGAGRAFGVDVDQNAIPAARKNAALNQVSDQAEFALGSVDEVRGGIFEIKQTPLVVANILAPILIRLLDAGLGDLVTPGGLLILSGILDEQVPDMVEKTQEYNLQVVDQRNIEDWVAFALRRSHS